LSGIDPSILIVGMLAAGIVAAVLLWPKGQPVRPAAPARVSPGRALIDHFEEVGRDSAGRIIAERLGLVEADVIAGKFGRAFGPPPAPPAPTPVPNP
jgi:hypothetical protein